MNKAEQNFKEKIVQGYDKQQFFIVLNVTFHIYLHNSCVCVFSKKYIVRIYFNFFNFFPAK